MASTYRSSTPRNRTKRSNHIKRSRDHDDAQQRGQDFVVSVPVGTQRVSHLQNRLFAEVKMIYPSKVLERTWRKRGVLKACVEGECYDAWSNYH